MAPTTNAHFITVDGIDGVGKSTQIEQLKNLMQQMGHPCIATRDPGSSAIGSRLRELLLESELTMHRRTEAMLFMASRCEMVETMIRPTLMSGTSVISDRFLLSTVVYQSVGDATNTVAPELLWKLGRLANDDLRPDLTILMDMSAEAAMRRITRPADRMESRGVDYMESVRQGFLAQLPQSSESTVVIDADQSAEAVESAIRDAVHAYLESSG